jgi:SagB-type dehydrogenase family enzyme
MAAKKRIGDRYQQETKYTRDGMKIYSSETLERSGQYKQYPDALNVVALPKKLPEAQAGFWKTVAGRRSIRDFADNALYFDELVLLLFATQGITEKLDDNLFRAAPSAGALYPVETYIMVNRVAGLVPGIYHLNVRKQSLELIRLGELGSLLAMAALGQNMISNSAATFIWTGIAGRSTGKYHERAYRYIYLEAGHIGQNLCLAAAALGLGCCTIGAFFDSEVNDIIGVDGESETAVYLSAVGRIQK